MIEDRFNIVSLGMCAKGANESKVITHLSKIFKINKRKAEKLLSRKKKVIKKGLDWAAATAYKNKLIKAGLVAEIDVVMSRELFIKSLVRNSDPTPKDALSTRHVWEIDIKKISPALFSWPSSTAIKSSNKTTLFNVSNLNPSLSHFSCLLITALLMFIAYYCFWKLSGQLLLGRTTTVISVVLTPLIAVFLPSVFSIRRLMRVTPDGGDVSNGTICVEKLNINPLERKYIFCNQQGNILAYVTQSRFRVGKLNCYSPGGELMFKSSHYLNFQGTGDFYRHYFNLLFSGELFREILKKFSPGTMKKQTIECFHSQILNREITPNLLISNASDRPIALLYKKKQAYIEVASRHLGDDSQFCLLLFSLLGFNAGS